MPTPQEYGNAYKRAVEAGNVDAANEIATHLNAMAKKSFLDEPMQKEAPIASPAPATGARGELPSMPSFGVDQTFSYDKMPEPMTSANVVRYGVPVVAGVGATMAGGPLIGYGAGIAAAGASEKIAQKMEGRDEPKEVLRSMALSAIPVIGQGRAVLRIAANVPMQIAGQAATEIALDGMTLDDYKKQIDSGELYKRWGTSMAITGGLSFVGGRGEKFSRVANDKDLIEMSRQGGTAMLHEYMPKRSWYSPRLWSYESLEGNALNRKNLNAVRLEAGMTGGFGPAILKNFPEVENGTEAATYLRTGFEAVQEASKRAQVSAENARRAVEALDIAKAGKADYRGMLDRAERSTFSKIHAETLTNVAKDKWFPKLDQSVKAVSEASVSDDVLRLADAAKGRVKSVNDGLYEAAGIGRNDVVNSVQDLISFAKKDAVNQKSPLNGANALREFEQDVKKHTLDRLKLNNQIPEGATPAQIAELVNSASLTKETVDELKDVFAKGLQDRGMEATKATSMASARYNVAKNSTNNFVKNAYPIKHDKWMLAQSSFAKNIQEQESGAMEMLRKGKANELVKSMLDHKGAGATHLNELKAYSDVIRTTFDPAIEGAQKAANDAADVFEAGINKSLGNALLDGVIRDTSGFGSVLTTAKIEKLAGDLAKLEKNGFPNIEALGFGTPSDINKLARLADTGRTNFTKEDVNAFFDMLPSVGADKAAAAVKYRKGISESFLLEGDARIRRQLQLNKEAKNSRLDAKMQAELYQNAKNDPILSFLEQNGSGLQLGEDLASDFKMTDRLLTVEPRLLSGLFDRLRKNQPDVADKLGKIAVRKFMLHLESEMTSGVTDRVNLGKILDNWNGTDDAGKVLKQNMTTMAGEGVTRILDEGFIKEMKKIVGVQLRMGSLYPVSGKPIVNAYGRMQTGAGGSEGGKGITGMMPSMVGVPIANLVNFLKDKRYNLAYKMYADPKWAPQFKAVGYNIDKFAAQGPVQRALVLSELHADEQERQKEAQKKAQADAAK